ncbi:hypothetical protein [Sediminibacterium sp.]|uniref:hypothetical protein n=1 Tax=Sediminibacterium sp. TaxID=1917865 RepID=UPI003F696E93
MSLGIIILTLLGVSILIFLIWNLSTLQRLKATKGFQKELNDPRYYELKYKQEYFVAVVSFVGTALVILGYSNIDSIKNSLSKEFTEKADSTSQKMIQLSQRIDAVSYSFDSTLTAKTQQTESLFKVYESNSKSVSKKLLENFSSTQNSLSEYIDQLNLLSRSQNEIANTNKISEQQVKDLLKKIDDLNSRNIIKQNYYIVDSLYFNIAVYDTAQSDDALYTKYFFKDLKTTFGDRLPKFENPPFVVYLTEHGAFDGKFKEITTESFKFTVGTYTEGGGKIIRFSVLILERFK